MVGAVRRSQTVRCVRDPCQCARRIVVGVELGDACNLPDSPRHVIIDENFGPAGGGDIPAEIQFRIVHYKAVGQVLRGLASVRIGHLLNRMTRFRVSKEFSHSVRIVRREQKIPIEICEFKQATRIRVTEGLISAKVRQSRH